MHIRQPNVMLSYWVIQAQHTHASNLNTLREPRNKTKQNKSTFKGKSSMALLFLLGRPRAQAGVSFGDVRLYTANLQWPSSFGIVCVTSTVDLQRHYF